MAEHIITKTCTRCKQTKMLSEFHKDRSRLDNHYRWCKVCANETVRTYYQTPEGKATKQRYTKKYLDQCRVCQKHYRQTENGKKSMQRKVQKYRQNYPERRKAGIAVSDAIRTGKLQPVNTFKCSQCTVQAQEYHHWHGYTPEHRLDVVPLCKPCHRHIHSVKQLSFS